jgi:hypothetical protein
MLKLGHRQDLHKALIFLLCKERIKIHFKRSLNHTSVVMPFIECIAVSKTRHFSMQEVSVRTLLQTWTVMLMEDRQEHKYFYERDSTRLNAVW